MPPPRDNGRARWIDVTRDLNPLADLLAIAFPDLDEEGHAALRQLRRIARSRRAQRMYARQEVPGAPLYGFVWEAEDRIVGNVSLVALPVRPKQYLIVNVATHPDYRRQGIARELMHRAIAHAQRKKAEAIWLQVDTYNRGAIALYENLGFQARDVVTQWQAQRGNPAALEAPASDLKIRPGLVRRKEWPQQRAWLEAIYPPDRRWNAPCRPWEVFAPTWQGWLQRLLRASAPRKQWVARRGEQLIGTALWLPRHGGATEALMLAAPPDLAADDVAALLAPVQARALRPLRAELPQGFLAEGLTAAGFLPKRHLLWMKKTL